MILNLCLTFCVFLNPFSPGKFEKLTFGDSEISMNSKHQ